MNRFRGMERNHVSVRAYLMYMNQRASLGLECCKLFYYSYPKAMHLIICNNILGKCSKFYWLLMRKGLRKDWSSYILLNRNGGVRGERSFYRIRATWGGTLHAKSADGSCQRVYNERTVSWACTAIALKYSYIYL